MDPQITNNFFICKQVVRSLAKFDLKWFLPSALNNSVFCHYYSSLLVCFVFVVLNLAIEVQRKMPTLFPIPFIPFFKHTLSYYWIIKFY